MPTLHPLVLASASPRREALLHLIRIPFFVMSSGVEESAPGDGAADPAGFVERAAMEKAEAVAGRVKDGLVLGADTVVVARGRMLGKPTDAQDAARMLRLLSGSTHEVHTGLGLIHMSEGSRGQALSGSEVTRVTFRELSEHDIGSYVATGEPMDKAGAYAIQGRGAVLVSGIEGCYYNVVGLPLTRLFEMLASIGVSAWEWAEKAS